MNIGIDARILERKMTGIGRFLNTFLNELPHVDSTNNYFLFSYENLSITNGYYKNIPTTKSFLPQKLFAPVWINFILPFFLKQHKIDLFFSVNQLIPLIKLKDTKYILVLHDVIYRVDKTFHPFIYRKYMQIFTYFSIKRSDLIVTVSEYSKRDILKHYKISEKKIRVVYQAAEKDFYPRNLTLDERSEIKKLFGLPEHIVLYIGMIENRKNIKCIIKIADEVINKNKNIIFLLVGKIGYGGKKLIKEIHKRENIKHILSVEDQLLKKLYNISSVFLFPSLYEGFGYPPLEAMQSGLPVVASNNTSLEEIISYGGILHHANDYKAFTNDIFKILNDKKLYLSIRNKGIERAKNFNIRKTVEELVDTFNLFK